MKSVPFFLLTLSIFSSLSLLSCNRSGKQIAQKQGDDLWMVLEEKEILNVCSDLDDVTMPGHFLMYVLNLEMMLKQLDKTPDRTLTPADQSSVEIGFPDANAAFNPFKMATTTIMEEALANNYPELKTYEGVMVNAVHTTLRLSRNPNGIDVMILSPDGTQYIDPILLNGRVYYLVYRKKDYIFEGKDRFFEPSKNKPH